ncbi:MAG: hypothetical protein HYY17_02915 [Planctomycetes bacterium]|nr:hypothetical protein [Planctomycetota bacterium]
MKLLFGDRWSWAKVGAALLAVTALCWHARGRLGALHPPVSEIRMYPGRHEGRTVFLAPARVVESRPDGFVVEKDDLPLTIRSGERPPAGGIVGLRGTVRGGEIVADAVREYPGYYWKRAAIYGVSGLLALLVAWRLLRRTRLDRGIFETRY